jgi:hypothetical protein
MFGVEQMNKVVAIAIVRYTGARNACRNNPTLPNAGNLPLSDIDILFPTLVTFSV